jgi:coenzyme F420-reducing hydrogenase beta subunit
MATVSEKARKDCSGCNVCAVSCPSACIRLNEDNEGFKYPNVDYKRCINCSKCLKICPFSKTSWLNEPLAYYAAQSIHDKYIQASSSGSIFPEFAKYILAQGGIVYGAAYDGRCVKHIGVSDIKYLGRIVGSKYVQSDTSESLIQCKQALERGTYVLYTGTGCQINALKAFLNKDYKNLFCIDIICHGVPSRIAFEEYCKYVEKVRHKTISHVNMRDKSSGWKSSRLRITYSDGTSEFNSPLCAIWSKIFQFNIALRPSCFNCTFCDIKRAGDITLGDFWGYDSSVCCDLDKNIGISEVLVNTDAGIKLLDSIKNDLRCCPITKEQAMYKQPHLSRSTEQPKLRKLFYTHLKHYPFYLVASYYCGYGVLGKIMTKLRLR